MKTFALLLCSLVLVTAVFLTGVAVTSHVVAEPEPHRFAHMDAPDLWTSKPVVIEQGKQSYERVAPAPQIASLPASTDGMSTREEVAANNSDDASTHPAVDDIETGAVNADQETAVARIDPAHADWCFERYRSYRIEDNTYQPFNGPRRTCESPWTPMPEDAQAQPDNGNSEVYAESGSEMQTVSYAENAAPAVGAHEEWCFARYRSYRVQDNSYQPFGGPRRACVYPHG